MSLLLDKIEGILFPQMKFFLTVLLTTAGLRLSIFTADKIRGN